MACHLLLLLLLTVSMVTATAPTVHDAVVCLGSEAGDQLQDELYLHCSQSGVINVLSAKHGYREQAADTKTCGPLTVTPGPCSADHAAFRQAVLRTCMGSSKCYVPVANVYLDDCRHNSNYVHVRYECIPDNSVEPDNIVDVCGEMMQGMKISRVSGYIKTPDYPDLYPPDISCTCSLTALDSHAHITLTMLDIQLEKADEEECKWDWLEYTTAAEGWGRGVRVCQQPQNNTNTNTFTGNKTVLLNFHADSKVEDRGFWLQYEGRNTAGDEVEVLLDCRNFQPNIVHKAVACVDKSGNSELYMDCQQNGVINVLSAQYGHKPAGGATRCEYVEGEECVRPATSDQTLLTRCMGQAVCTLSVSATPLPPCAAGLPSNYLQAIYQCIPEAVEPTSMVDVCGDVLRGGAAYRHSGYIQSPRYPLSYPPGLRCQCLLSTDEGAALRLRLLDVLLAADTVTGVCDADWLAVVTSHAAPWGSGQRLCNKPRGHVVQTGASEIRLDFRSDASVEDRGFWVHYSALRPDGLNVGVQIMCQVYEDDEPQYVNDDTEGATPLTPDVNMGLVVGLSVITVLIVIVLLVLAVLKYRRIRKGKLKEAGEITEKGNTFNKYSHFAEVGKNQSDSQRRYVEPHPDYDVTTTDAATSQDGGTPGSYVNPAYDGTLEPASYQNVAC